MQIKPTNLVVTLPPRSGGVCVQIGDNELVHLSVSRVKANGHVGVCIRSMSNRRIFRTAVGIEQQPTLDLDSCPVQQTKTDTTA